MQIVNRVRELRECKELTQDELALRAGISRVFLSEIENGKRNPSILVAEQLAKALGTSKDALFYESKPKTG